MRTGDESLGEKSILLPRGPQALLFLHGFTSTPQSLAPVGEQLAAAGFTVSMPVLPGHGTTPEDMAAHSGEDWLAFALQAWDQLAREYPNPGVIGLSMGGALAVHIAANRPVPALAALAPAFYLYDWRVIFLPIVKWFMPWKTAIGNDVKGTRFQEKTYSRFKLKNLEDLLQVAKTARQELPGLRLPVLGIQADVDHTVWPGCLDYFITHVGSESKEKHQLHDSYHVITLDNEYLQVSEWLISFFHKHLPARWNNKKSKKNT